MDKNFLSELKVTRTDKIYSVEEIKQMSKGTFKKYGIKKAYLFGSYARGEATPSSDIDLYIILDNLNSLDESIDISTNIRMALRKKGASKGIDLLLNDINTFNERKKLNGTIEYIVFTEGVIIYE